MKKLKINDFEYLIDGEVIGIISKRKGNFDVSFEDRKDLGDFWGSVFYFLIKPKEVKK